MKYEINYTCGHAGTVELYGKLTEREKKIKWLQTCVCTDCYKKQKALENAKEAKNNAVITAAFDFLFPQIEGKSEKQIAFAKDMRDKYILAYKDVYLSRLLTLDENARNKKIADGKNSWENLSNEQKNIARREIKSLQMLWLSNASDIIDCAKSCL